MPVASGVLVLASPAAAVPALRSVTAEADRDRIETARTTGRDHGCPLRAGGTSSAADGGGEQGPGQARIRRCRPTL